MKKPKLSPQSLSLWLTGVATGATVNMAYAAIDLARMTAKTQEAVSSSAKTARGKLKSIFALPELCLEPKEYPELTETGEIDLLPEDAATHTGILPAMRKVAVRRERLQAQLRSENSDLLEKALPGAKDMTHFLFPGQISSAPKHYRARQPIEAVELKRGGQ